MGRGRCNRRWLTRLVLGLTVSSLSGPLVAREEPTAAPVYALSPIGWVRVEGARPRLVIEPHYRPALLGLEPGMRIWVLYWFDRNDQAEPRARLQVHPRGDPSHPLRGVFATRAPLRPNPIGLSQCRILTIEDTAITVDALDAWNETPILDIKPVRPDE